MTRSPYPPLARIERELFCGESKSGAGDADHDLVDPAWAHGDNPASIPLHLFDMIERRVAATRAWPPEPLAAGQIRRLNVVRDAHGGQRQLSRTCGVLLGHRVGEGRWSGWLVAQETAWASDRDLVLQEEDGVLAPEAAMVQAWNPVVVELDGEEVILGKLSATCVATVARLARHSPEEFVAPRPGRIGAWRLDRDTAVVTGTPLSSSGDPRSAYQALYRTLAAQLGVVAARPAAAARRASASKDNWTSWLRTTFVTPAWTFGIAGLAVFQAALLVSSVHDSREPDVVYRSVPEIAGDAACRTRIRLTFRVDVPFAEAAVALRRIDAQLVAGPSETGEVWIVPARDPDPDLVAAALLQSGLVEHGEVVRPEASRCKR